MPRGKDAPTQVGGQIDPYVQRSIQQSKQLAESRLVAAMQESGATKRTAMQEGGATARAGIQAGAAVESQRISSAAQAESDDKRAAENERARREDREFTKTMTKINQGVQSKEAELDRAMQVALAADNRADKKEIAERQISFDKFRAILGEKSQIRQTNVMVSMLKGTRNRMEDQEKRKTAMYSQADEFDNDKEIYDLSKESVLESITNDKRMDLPARKPRAAFRGAGIGMSYPSPAESQEKLADPMGVLQDQIITEEGKISVEDLSSANIHKIEEQMINEEVRVQEINSTLGAMDAMLGVIDEKRKSVDKKSDEFDFWNDQHINISQFKRNLIGLEDSTKPIKGSKTETVGKRILYALKTIRRGSLGNRVSRWRGDNGDEDFAGLDKTLSESLEPYKPLDILSDDLDEYDIEARTFINNSIIPLYQKTEIGGLE